MTQSQQSDDHGPFDDDESADVPDTQRHENDQSRAFSEDTGNATDDAGHDAPPTADPQSTEDPQPTAEPDEDESSSLEQPGAEPGWTPPGEPAAAAHGEQAGSPRPAPPRPAPPRAGGPRPTAPRPSGPHPSAPHPATPHPSAPAAHVPHPETSSLTVIAPPTPSMTVEEAARWGRVDGDGTVYLTVDGQEQVAGQYPDVPAEEAMAYFIRKFDEVRGKVELLEQRVFAHAPTTDMRRTIDHAREQLAERAMIGDVLDLEQRLTDLSDKVSALEAEERRSHDEARREAVAAREAIVAEAEALAAKDPATVQWKSSSTRMNALFESWKSAQRSGVRLSRGVEDGLWKRFRAARTTFDKHRRAFFSQLDDTNAAAKREKETLIAEAEALSTSTDWGATAGEYRHLMDRWKASPRASRKDDDALWARFRAAQDAFFSARSAANAAVDAEFSQNLRVKEELLREAQALLPVKDAGAARKALGPIQERWETAGKVPRGDMHRMESGMRSVEDAVAKAERDHWKRTDPETKARTNSALSQLEATIASLEDDLASAEAAGDRSRIDTARQALDARRQWLDTLQRSAEDFH